MDLETGERVAIKCATRTLPQLTANPPNLTGGRGLGGSAGDREMVQRVPFAVVPFAVVPP